MKALLLVSASLLFPSLAGAAEFGELAAGAAELKIAAAQSVLPMPVPLPPAEGLAGRAVVRVFDCAAERLDEELLEDCASKAQQTPALPRPLPSPAAAAGTMSLDSVINIGEKIWKVVQDNKAVADVGTKWANAVPANQSALDNLGEFKGPAKYVIRVYIPTKWEAMTGNPAPAISAKFLLMYYYGGRYMKDGTRVGHYLNGVGVTPLGKSYFSWGTKFSLWVAIPDAAVGNVGPLEDPVAKMNLTVNYSLTEWTGLMGIMSSSKVFEIRGTGELTSLGGDGAPVTEM